VTLPPHLPAEPVSAEARVTGVLASTVCILVTLVASEERVACDDALAKVTNTGGILDSLAVVVGLTVPVERAVPDTVLLGPTCAQYREKDQ
jgi:hypothetical protein